MTLFILVAIFLAFLALAAGYFFHAGKSAVDRIIHRIVATVLTVVLALINPLNVTLAFAKISQVIMVDFFYSVVMGTGLYFGVLALFWVLACRLTHLGGEMNYSKRVRMDRKENPDAKYVITAKDIDRALKKFRQKGGDVKVIDLDIADQ